MDLLPHGAFEVTLGWSGPDIFRHEPYLELSALTQYSTRKVEGVGFKSDRSSGSSGSLRKLRANGSLGRVGYLRKLRKQWVPKEAPETGPCQ